MNEFAKMQWQRALRTMSSARQLIETDPDSAASRAYYAAFHALTTLFAFRGQSFSKHSALRAALHRDLIKTSQWPVELGKAFDFLTDIRETGDYGGLIQVSRSDAELAIEKAQTIIDQVRYTLPELGQ